MAQVNGDDTYYDLQGAEVYIVWVPTSGTQSGLRGFRSRYYMSLFLSSLLKFSIDVSNYSSSSWLINLWLLWWQLILHLWLFWWHAVNFTYFVILMVDKYLVILMRKLDYFSCTSSIPDSRKFSGIASYYYTRMHAPSFLKITVLIIYSKFSN